MESKETPLKEIVSFESKHSRHSELRQKTSATQ